MDKPEYSEQLWELQKEFWKCYHMGVYLKYDGNREVLTYTIGEYVSENKEKLLREYLGKKYPLLNVLIAHWRWSDVTTVTIRRVPMFIGIALKCKWEIQEYDRRRANKRP